MNNMSISGRIIFSDYKETEKNGTTVKTLRLKVSVQTGERKKNPEDYPPSMIVGVVVFGNYASALQERAVKGAYLITSGSLAVPTIYGESGINLELFDVNKVDILELADKNQSETPATTTKSTKSTKSKKVEEAEDIEVDDEDIPF